MMPLVDRPFVEHQIDHLRRHGIDRRRVLVRLPPGRAARPTSATARPWACACGTSWTPSRSAPPARSRTPRTCSTTTPFLVLNGDILTDLDLGASMRAPSRDGRRGTLALTPVDDPSAFGLVRLHDDGSRRGVRREAAAGRAAPGRALPHQRRHLPAASRRLVELHPRRPRRARSSARSSRSSPRRAPARLPERRLLARHRHPRLVPGGRPRRAARARCVTESPTGAAATSAPGAPSARGDLGRSLSSLGAGAGVGSRRPSCGQRRRRGARVIGEGAAAGSTRILGAGRHGSARARASAQGRGGGRRRRHRAPAQVVDAARCPPATRRDRVR